MANLASFGYFVNFAIHISAHHNFPGWICDIRRWASISTETIMAWIKPLFLVLSATSSLSVSVAAGPRWHECWMGLPHHSTCEKSAWLLRAAVHDVLMSANLQHNGLSVLDRQRQAAALSARVCYQGHNSVRRNGVRAVLHYNGRKWVGFPKKCCWSMWTVR